MTQSSLMIHFRTMTIAPALLAAIVFFGFSGTGTAAENQPPAVGDAAPKLELKSYDSETVKLDEAHKKGPVVVIVLRGNPGLSVSVVHATGGSVSGGGQRFCNGQCDGGDGISGTGDGTGS